MLTVTFQTVISCNGCNESEAFASEYPLSFGEEDDDEEDDTDNAGGRNLGLEGSDNKVFQSLNAASIITNIERRMNVALPNFGKIAEATIVTQQAGETGGTDMKHMRSSYYYEEEEYGVSVYHLLMSCY